MAAECVCARECLLPGQKRTEGQCTRCLVRELSALADGMPDVSDCADKCRLLASRFKSWQDARVRTALH
ncbi:MAG: hypothetical protein HQL35_08295 [Alphaproteobacteria bacterium]|nr:hypothetical protein [Alphaproteobacteria bacterium]